MLLHLRLNRQELLNALLVLLHLTRSAQLSTHLDVLADLFTILLEGGRDDHPLHVFKGLEE